MWAIITVNEIKSNPNKNDFMAKKMVHRGVGFYKWSPGGDRSQLFKAQGGESLLTGAVPVLDILFLSRFAQNHKISQNGFDSPRPKIKDWKKTSLYFRCPGGESNSHDLRRTILSRVRLPIPPLRLMCTVYQIEGENQCDIIAPWHRNFSVIPYFG